MKLHGKACEQEPHLRWTFKPEPEKRMRTSARNHFAGHIADGEKIVSIITNESVDRLGLAVGKPTTAIFKASGVIVGVE